MIQMHADRHLGLLRKIYHNGPQNIQINKCAVYGSKLENHRLLQFFGSLQYGLDALKRIHVKSSHRNLFGICQLKNLL